MLFQKIVLYSWNCKFWQPDLVLLFMLYNYLPKFYVLIFISNDRMTSLQMIQSHWYWSVPPRNKDFMVRSVVIRTVLAFNEWERIEVYSRGYRTWLLDIFINLTRSRSAVGTLGIKRSRCIFLPVKLEVACQRAI